MDCTKLEETGVKIEIDAKIGNGWIPDRKRAERAQEREKKHEADGQGVGERTVNITKRHKSCAKLQKFYTHKILLAISVGVEYSNNRTNQTDSAIDLFDTDSGWFTARVCMNIQ